MDRNLGIHHITAIASDAAANFDFFSRVLGLRLVKKTVNFDDPETYHLYYGDESGAPGTILTFFPWPGARRGRPGVGQATAIAFAIPTGSRTFWQERSLANGMFSKPIDGRLGDRGLALRDPDGMAIELIEGSPPSPSAARKADVPLEAAITGLHSTALELTELRPTTELLTAVMGFERFSEDGRRFRYRAAGTPGTFIDLVRVPSGPWGQTGAGTVHHVAFRARDDEDQLRWHEALVAEGFEVTGVRDRNYFHSIYFREPGGVLFEIATDGPGFSVDESPENLGKRLMLPPWLEETRARLEAVLPPLEPVTR